MNSCYRANGTCDSCSAGLYGNKCSIKCPANCKYNFCDQVTGTCIGCEANFYGEECTELCQGCLGGICDQDDGSCTKGCMPGSCGIFCEDSCHEMSPDGTCNQTCCSADDYHGVGGAQKGQGKSLFVSYIFLLVVVSCIISVVERSNKLNCLQLLFSVFSN